jgi:hypothetical protein
MLNKDHSPQATVSVNWKTEGKGKYFYSYCYHYGEGIGVLDRVMALREMCDFSEDSKSFVILYTSSNSSWN